MADVEKIPPPNAKPEPSRPKPTPVSREHGLETPRSVHC